MTDGSSSFKSYVVTIPPQTTIKDNKFTFESSHNLKTGEKVIVVSDDGDLSENLETDKVYYVITDDVNSVRTDSVTLSSVQIELASSETNAENASPISVSGGSNLKIITRVSDKVAGDEGHPVQYDEDESNWYIKVSSTGNTITGALTGTSTDPSYIKRTNDNRSVDEKLYKLRVVVPKETVNGKTPENGFVIQESSSTGLEFNSDISRVSMLSDLDYRFDRNPRFISTCSYSSDTITVISEIPHNLNTNDIVVIRNVKDSTNTTGEMDAGYNGTFKVTSITDDMTFSYLHEDVDGNDRSPGSIDLNDSKATRTTSSPRFEKNDLQSNLYIYRREVISEYEQGVRDGIYHLYVLNANNSVTEEFTNLKYSQNVVNLYPQLDRDNTNDNPQSSKSFAARHPLGKVETDDLKKSVTRETLDSFSKSIGIGKLVSTGGSGANPTITFSRRHGLSGITTGYIGESGSDYNHTQAGTVNNVKLLLTNQTGEWRGATADVTTNASGNILM